MIKDSPPDDFKGDRVLARSIALMQDLMWSRKCAYAVAEGDTGRVYEILKVTLSLYIYCNAGHAIHVRRIQPYQIYNIFS